MHFENHGVSGGNWRGTLTGRMPLRLCVTCSGEVVASARISGPASGPWQVDVDLPGSVLSDGTHSMLLVTCGEDGQPGPGAPVLGRLDLRMGQPLAEDLIAEIALLRAELDLIKREFRRFAARD